MQYPFLLVSAITETPFLGACDPQADVRIEVSVFDQEADGNDTDGRAMNIANEVMLTLKDRLAFTMVDQVVESWDSISRQYLYNSDSRTHRAILEFRARVRQTN